MSWLVFALCGPVLWATSTHLDKYLVERYFKDTDVVVLLLFTALMGLALMPLIATFEPGVFRRDALSIALMSLSGILYMGAIVFYLRALQGHEASVVAPFFQSSPLFGYALAYFILGEKLTGTQLAGGALIVFGVLFVSIGFGPKRERFRWRLAALMIACGFVLSLSTLIFKAFALRDEFWATTFWMFAGEAVFGACFLSIGTYRGQFFKLLRSNGSALLAINASNELINVGGGLSNRYALLFAPLSIVQAIGSTTTLFVFAIGVMVTLLFPKLSREDLSAREFVSKGIAAVLVAAGVTLVSR
ncbi:MAG TPA: DMT family transporter [Xanthobacteraceae bacterium]|nr:DMT family transporter [Xanthobacteraceae bacterium]